MSNYYSGVCSHWFDSVETVRRREQSWRERDEQQAAVHVPELWLAAAARHEGGHAVTAVALSQTVHSVQLTPAGGTTRISRSDNAFDALIAMIVTAAGKAAQQRYGARHSYYSRWCADDESELIRLAVDITTSNRVADVVRVIEGAEAVAKQFVDDLWDTIETVAQALIQFPGNKLECADVEWFCRNIKRIDFHRELAARSEEQELDGVVYRRRIDGFLKPICGRGHPATDSSGS
jgi:hypothetical protein